MVTMATTVALWLKPPQIMELLWNINYVIRM